MNCNIKMETENKEQVCLSDSYGVLPDGSIVEPQIQTGDSTSKHTGNSMNLIQTTLLNSGCSDYSSESEDTEELFDGDAKDNLEGESVKTSVGERMELEKVHKYLDANSKLTLHLTALEKKLTVKLAKIQQKIKSMRASKSILHYGNHLQSVDLQSCFPYFQPPPTESVCPVNEDSLTKVTRNELVFSNLSPFSHWTPGDKILLKKAVQRAIDMRQLHSETPTVMSVCCASRSESQALGTAEIEDHDWENIAKKFQEKHSAAECRGMWINHLQPSLNCKPFTLKVQKRLSKLAEQYGKQDWDAIAAALGTGYSALQCYILYINKCTGKKKYHWNGEENSYLQQQLLKNQLGRSVDWNAVSFHMQRPRKAIAEHWKYVANPNIKKGKFTPTESGRLLKGIKVFGTNFSKISLYFLPSRTSKQLRSHYKKLVTPTVMGNWSTEEDRNLLHLVEKYSTGNWSQICKHFIDPIRTRGQVRSRYLVLKRRLSSSKSRRTNNHEEESQIDIDIETFLRVNFVERSEWSLEKSFIPPQEEVEKQACDIKQLLPLLNAKLTITNEILETDVSISNRDKLVFYQLQKELSDEKTIDPLDFVSPHRTSVLDATQNVFKDGQMITFPEETDVTCISTSSTASGSRLRSSALPIDAQQSCKSGFNCIEDSVTDSIHSECSSTTSLAGDQDHSTPHSPCEADATSATEHSDLLLPSVPIIDTLIDIFLDKDLDDTGSVQPFNNLEEDNCNESFKTADNLFMERLKTVFLYPLLLTTKNVELAETIVDDDTTSNTGNLNVEEIICTNDDVSSKVRKRGRPCKRKKITVSDEEQVSQPKRKYVKTGKYSRCKNITPRVSLRTSCRKPDNTQESLPKSN